LREEAVKFGVVAATWHPQIVYSYVETSHEPWAIEPSQCINYVSCHDNFTLYDKLKMSVPKPTPDELRKMVKLAGAIILTSQGIPFLHAGVEFCRTKMETEIRTMPPIRSIKSTGSGNLYTRMYLNTIKS
jgi:pullulanase